MATQACLPKYTMTALEPLCKCGILCMSHRRQPCESRKISAQLPLQLLSACICNQPSRFDLLPWLCRYETAKLDDGSHRERPVVRLHGGVVLTRIDPNNRDTSMIMRIRPGWESLRAFLAPELSKGHPRVAK